MFNSMYVFVHFFLNCFQFSCQYRCNRVDCLERHLGNDLWRVEWDVKLKLLSAFRSYKRNSNLYSRHSAAIQEMYRNLFIHLLEHGTT